MQMAVLLGNPGREYEKTRHNIGFMLADLAASRLAPGSRWRDWKGLGLYLEFEAGGRRVFLLKPQTYMNLSGQAVQSLAAFYKIPPPGVLAAYDDLALPFGKLRMRKGGSAGSHNGMASVISALGPALPRLRLGIGPRPAHIPGKNFVLSGFSKEEGERLADFLDRACGALKEALLDGVESAMNRCNYDGDKPVH
ncbi:MAG: aminoacyl-tRNA hydrolase [Elusimicrobia bacterium GWA2_61_42]|nr:MAG: aminoacyl-tRNA hydrolase [Elusimicrobia bacterium GWA2_61_42]OGR78806.1 MAG: aminoacyl-tRNA hydrolase [Elusimicrobia bacterium GWC2_61_25]